MTIDSAYFFETHEVSRVDPVYFFGHENIGADTIIPWVTYTDGVGDFISRRAINTEYSITLGGEVPIYWRGRATILDPNLTLPGDDTVLYFFRKTPITQLYNFLPRREFPSERVEFGADKLTLILQEIDGDKCGCDGGGINFDKEGPVGPALPECEPYSCSALNDELAAQGIVFIYDGLADAGAWAWPFATASGEGFTAWANFISSPNVIPDWAGYIAKGDITGWSWYVEAATLSLCSSPTPAQAMDISYLFVNALTIPNSLYIPSASSSTNLVFTGFQGGDHAQFELRGRTMARWASLDSGGIGIGVGENELYINLYVITGNTEYGIRITVGRDAGRVNEEFSIGAVGGRWLNCTITETSWAEVENGDAKLWTTATVTVTAKDGTQYSSTATGYRIFNYGPTVASIELAAPTSLYNSPRHFYCPSDSGQAITIASFAFNGTQAVDADLIGERFLHNFNDYTPPGYCSGPA